MVMMVAVIIIRVIMVLILLLLPDQLTNPFCNLPILHLFKGGFVLLGALTEDVFLYKIDCFIEFVWDAS
jgi:hypothetical protein